MKVVHVEPSQHAVLGGGAARRVRIEESPEFFKMAIDAYQDKPLAVVREILCNAWDEHVKAGKEGTPIEVTLTDTDLIIRDFGPGISDDHMEEVFCRIGATTKLDEDNQTGGFGIGAMSPLTYTDWFNVTSFHAGRAKQYVVSKGSEETLGYPELRNMVDSPSSDLGLEVQVPLTSVFDKDTFHSKIMKVVSMGGMNATLNEKPLPRTDYSKVKDGGYLYFPGKVPFQILVKVGSVVYPLIAGNQDLEYAVLQASGLRQSGTPRAGTLILLAEPNSVGIAPSREGLSYTKSTMKYLLRKINKVGAEIARERKYALSVYATSLAEKCSPGDMTLRKNLMLSANPLQKETQAKKIAFDLLMEDVAYSVPGGVILPALLKSMQKKHPWMNHLDLGESPELMDYRDTLDRYVRYFLAKEQAKAGLAGKLGVFSTKGFTPLTKTTPSLLGLDRLLVGASQKDIREHRKFASKQDTVLILRSGDREGLPEFVGACQRIGIPVEMCAASEKAKTKPKKGNTTTLNLTCVTKIKLISGYDGNQKFSEWGRTILPTAPKVYLPVTQLTEGFRPRDKGLSPILVNLVDCVGPEAICLAYTSTEEKLLVSNGAVTLTAHVMKKIVEARDTPDFKIGFLIHREIVKCYRDTAGVMLGWWQGQPRSLMKILGITGKPVGDPMLYTLGATAFRWAVKHKEAAVATLLKEMPLDRADKLSKKLEEEASMTVLGRLEKMPKDLSDEITKSVLKYNREWIEKGDLK